MKNTIKRLTVLILALSMTMGLLCTGAWAEEVIETKSDVSVEELLSDEGAFNSSVLYR